MAKTEALRAGMDVVVTRGNYAGYKATVVDPVAIPDGGDHRAGPENQRKVLVELPDIGVSGEPLKTYLLPRLLDMGEGAAATVRPHVVQPVVEAPVDDSDRELAYAALQGAIVANSGLPVDGLGVVVTSEPITDVMDPALDRYRPDPKVVDHYINRVLPGGWKDVEVFLHMREQRDRNGYSPNIALVGETQSGKSMFVQVLAVLAAKRDGHPKPYPMFTINGSSGVTSYDIFGQTTAVLINGQEVLVWMEGVVALAARIGGLLNLEEWNAVPPAQAIALHPLLDDTRRFINTQKAVPDGHGGYMPEEVKVNPLLWVLSTINPGYKGTQVMAEASTNRFIWMPWDYDEDIEKQLIPSKSIRTIGQVLREAGHLRIVSIPVGTTALQRFNMQAAQFGVDFAVFSFLSTFPPAERARVQTILEDDGKIDHLRSEYPRPLITPTKVEDAGAAAKLGNTWDPNSIARTS